MSTKMIGVVGRGSWWQKVGIELGSYIFNPNSSQPGMFQTFAWGRNKKKIYFKNPPSMFQLVDPYSIPTTRKIIWSLFFFLMVATADIGNIIGRYQQNMWSIFRQMTSLSDANPFGFKTTIYIPSYKNILTFSFFGLLIVTGLIKTGIILDMNICWQLLL